MSDQDGDLSEVNPRLLEMCSDPEAWKEQRRQAIRARILAGNGGGGGSDGGGNRQAPATGEVSDKNAAYVLAQIQSRKRRDRDDDDSMAPPRPNAMSSNQLGSSSGSPHHPQAPPPSPATTAGQPGGNLKARLMQRFGNQGQS